MKRTAIAQSMLARMDEEFVTIEIEDETLELYDGIQIENVTYCVIGHVGKEGTFVNGYMPFDKVVKHDMKIPYRKMK